ncbi:MAG TPA: hypothetical protein VHE14_05600 [Solirubrobacteraceae bacterium]|nr:hypothetical protein [Solirubrobacteraceae bacterium]
MSGRANLAIWRYPRVEPLPHGRAALRQAATALAAAARVRDPKLRLDGPPHLVTVQRAPGIELRGTERPDGRDRRFHSLHLFERRAEIVIDAYAEPSQFATLERGVFVPLLRSLRLFKPRRH